MTINRAQRVLEVWQERGGEPLTMNTRRGAVTLVKVVAGADDAGACWVDVWTAPGGEPGYRIFNPPLMVGDAESPLVALAEVIGQHGGAAPVRGRVIR